MSEEKPHVGMKPVYMEYILKMRKEGMEHNRKTLTAWQQAPAELRGPAPRAALGALGVINAFLHHVTGEREYAEEAASLLASEEHNLYEYVRAYGEIRDASCVTPEKRAAIETKIVDMAEQLIHHHVEWGAMNHATNYIVDGMTAAAMTLPDHPRCPVWRQFAEKMLATSRGKWGIEDSQNYSPIWFMPMVNHADLTEDRSFFLQPATVYYFHYYLSLLSPAGGIPEFGDGGWGGSWERFTCLLERGAAEYRNGAMKYAARTIFERFRTLHTYYQAGPLADYNWMFVFAARITDAWRWADDTVEEHAPTGGSQEALDDQIGKKVVFRNGWDEQSTYMLLNYMDVPPFGVDGRDMLRTTIPVETEKTHHGQAEENTICCLMSRGAVLLGESGYRETDTTGPNGEFRADTFHNRIVARHGIADPQIRILPFLLDTGRYRFVSTTSVHFHNLRAVDVSRTRLRDLETGYQWDRVVVYLKSMDIFVLFDVLKILRPGSYTFASLLYGQSLVDQSAGQYEIRQEQLGFLSNVPNPDTASLVICFPDRENKREGVEQIRRAYQNQMAIYQAVSDCFDVGGYVTFTTALIPRPKETGAFSIPDMVAVKETDGDAGVGLCLSREQGEILLWVKLDPEAAYLEENIRPRYTFESGRSRCGDLETDARFVYLETSPGKVAYSFIEATRLDYQDKTLFISPQRPMRQDDGVFLRNGAIRWRAWEDEALLDG